MKKLIYISFVFAVLIAFASCEKQDVLPVDNNDPFAVLDENGNGTNGTKDPMIEGDNETDGGGIVDPDEDDDDLDDDGGLDRGKGK